MLERFTYTNNFDETLEFGKDCLFANENDLRDFAWEITSKNNRISSFKKGIVSKTIPVILKCNSEAEGIKLKNRLFEVFEKDVLAQKAGKLRIGDYYLNCYVTGSKKTEYLFHKNYMRISLTVQTDLPSWIKETTTTHIISPQGQETYLDFPYDFSFDFRNKLAKTEFTNTDFIPSNFIITIEGGLLVGTQNPTLYINGHKYAVNVLVGWNEKLVIDSVKKTVVLIRENGEEVNCFKYRDRDSYLFEKIPSGTNVITSPNERIKFHMTLLEERSEPKWI